MRIFKSYRVADAQNVENVEIETKGEDDTRNYKCGFFAYRPEWLQVFNNSKFLLFLVCGFTFIQSFAVNGINNANTTSYERRFGLQSSKVGFIASSYDIAAGIVVIPISYMTSNLNKHTVLGLASGTMGIGMFIMVLSHFITDVYQWGDSVQDICFSGNGTDHCIEESTNLSYYLYVLIGGQLVLGIAGCAMTALGVVVLDDGAPSKSSPMYFSAMYSAGAIGTAAGYLLGGYFLEFHVDFEYFDSIPLKSDDPRWVGAWWLGFLVAMVILFLLAVPFLALPRHISVTIEDKAKNDVNPSSCGETKGTTFVSFKELPQALKSLITNPLYILITLASSFEYMFVSGMSTFASKFLQNQFGQTSGLSAVLAGAALVPGAAGGFVLGGIICRRFNLGPVGLARSSALCSFIALLLSSILWSTCDGVKMAGITVNYHDRLSAPTSASILNRCNYDCGCSQESYTPVCGADGIQFFSACHAGCTIETDKNYAGCSCINATFGQTATPGVCESECPLLYVFIPVFFIIILVTCLPAIFTTMASLRIVPPDFKTFAIGCQWVPLRLLGTVPGPILLGVIIDKACVVWKTSCGTSTEESCWIYNNVEFSRNLFFAVVTIKTVSCTLYLTGSLLYKPPEKETSEKGDNSSNHKDVIENGNTQVPSESR